MVYRLVPSYRFRATSHFGMEDMSKPKLWKGVVLGLVLALVVLGVLAYVVLKQNKLQRYAKMNDQGLPVVLVCSLVGGAMGHHLLVDDSM
jgi:CDP-diglyceride synthetase